MNRKSSDIRGRVEIHRGPFKNFGIYGNILSLTYKMSTSQMNSTKISSFFPEKSGLMSEALGFQRYDGRIFFKGVCRSDMHKHVSS